MRDSSRFAEFRLMAGYVRASLRMHVWTALALGALAVVLGAAPTIQSAIESNVLQTLAEASSIGDDGRSADHSFTELASEWDVTVPGLEQFLPGGDVSTGWVMPLGWALVAYAVLLAFIVLFEVLSARASARIVRGYFVSLQRRGWSGALHATPGLERRLSETRRAALDRAASAEVDRNDDEVEELSGYWSRAIQEGAEAVSHTAVNAFSLGRNLITFATATFLIVQLGWQVLLAFFAVVAITVSLTVLQARRLRVSRQRLESKSAVLSGRMNDALAHRDLIRAWEQTKRVQDQIEDDAGQMVRVEQDLAVSAATYREAGRAVFDVGRLAAALCFVVFVSVQRDRTLDVFLVSTLYFRLLTPVQQLAFWIDYLARTQATTRIFSTVVEESNVVTDTDFVPPEPGSGGDMVIEFRDVEFSYPRADEEERHVFDGISFDIPRGKATLLVGRSGGGKTTIARMMMGFITPTRGFVNVEGVDATVWSSSALLKKFSYVAQGHNVLHGTVRDNLFNESASAESMTDALDRVGLPFVQLQDSATKLSTGQQQRLALARLLVSEEDIIVLDEPTTGLDAFTMRELMPVLSELLFSGRTVVMITHRLVFAEQFDHVVMLLDRVRVETGAPSELLKKPDGAFSSLYEFARNELEGAPS